MTSLRHGVMFAAALAACSLAPGAEQKAAPAPKTGSGLQDAPTDGDAVQRREDAMRRMFTDLAEENVKLRKENKDLRDDNEALARKLEEYEKLLRQRLDNRGTFVLPPEALRGDLKNAVPPTWKPFEFNGATYYLVPLRDDGSKATAQKLGSLPAGPQK